MLIRRLIHLSSRLVPTLLCVVCVPLVVIGLVHWRFGVPLSAFRPLLNDEVYYWHQALTFARAGFNGGYYTLEEVTNPSGVTPFGPHGAGFVVLYGLTAKIFEWHRHSVLVLNLLVIAVACWIWATSARLTTARLWLSILLLGTFWQMLFWASSGMQESFHHAGAIVMAALFARALASAPSTWLVVCGSLMLSLLALVRPTWIVVMPLWALVITRQSDRKRTIAAVAASLVAGAAMLLIFNRTVAPYSRGFSFVEVFNRSAASSPSIVENLLFNLRRTISFADYDVLEILHRAQYWGFLVAALALAIVLWRRRASWRTGPLAHLAVSATLLVTMLGLILVLYSLTNWGEHRVLSAFLLLGVLLTLAAPGRVPVVLVAALILSNVATTSTFIRVFEAKRQEQFVWDRRGVYALEEALTGHLTYRKDQGRWCNTLLTAQTPPYLTAVPAGIGISVVREPDQMTTPRSHYLLLDPTAVDNFRRPVRTRPLVTLPYGTLYENLDSGCK